MQFNRKTFETAAVFFVLTACSPGHGAGTFDDDVPESERFGGTAVIGGYGDLQSMNPLVSSDNISNMIQRDMLFMTLIRYDDEMQPVPYLAESWDTVRIHADSLALTWRLRSDVRWHDGTPTTAEDVLFTFERITDPRTAFPRIQALAQYNPEAELIDSRTVRMRFRAHAEFLDIFVMTAIAPKHILESTRPEELLQHDFGYHPVGNGPFRFVRYAGGQEWVFEANPDFPEALGGRPFLDRIVYRTIPQMTTLLTELLTGRIDIYFQPNPDQAAAIEQNPGTELRTYPSRQYNYLAFNTRLPIFQDARTRRAIAMGINREEIVDALVYGFGTVGRSTVPPTNWAYNEEAYIPHDPEKARRLLAEAGWTPGPDGFLRDDQGRQLRFTIITNDGNDVRRDMAVIIQAHLRQLGIQVQPRLIEWTTMIAQLQGSLNRQGVRERNFEAVIGGWVTAERVNDAGILHSRSMDQPYQYVGYSDPRIDMFIDTLDIMLDRAEALPLWHEYQNLVAHEAPYVPLYYPERLNGLSTRLRGVVFDVRGETTTAAQWWIHPRARQPMGAAPAAIQVAGEEER